MVLLSLHFQGIGSRGIGGGAGHRPLEIDRDIGKALAGLGIRHLALHPGCLGENPDREEQHAQGYETDS